MVFSGEREISIGARRKNGYSFPPGKPLEFCLCLGPLYTTPGWAPIRVSSASNFTFTRARAEWGLGQSRATRVSFIFAGLKGLVTTCQWEKCNHQFVLALSAILPMLFACAQLHGFLILMLMLQQQQLQATHRPFFFDFNGAATKLRKLNKTVRKPFSHSLS